MLYADTGGAPTAVEGRLYDLRFQVAGDLPPLPAGPPAISTLSGTGPAPDPVALPPAVATGGRWTLARAAGTFVVGLAAGFALTRRMRSRT